MSINARGPEQVTAVSEIYREILAVGCDFPLVADSRHSCVPFEKLAPKCEETKTFVVVVVVVVVLCVLCVSNSDSIYYLSTPGHMYGVSPRWSGRDKQQERT